MAWDVHLKVELYLARILKKIDAPDFTKTHRTLDIRTNLFGHRTQLQTASGHVLLCELYNMRHFIFMHILIPESSISRVWESKICRRQETVVRYVGAWRIQHFMRRILFSVAQKLLSIFARSLSQR